MVDNLISTSIPNLVNGVSQQAPTLRSSSQCELQENAYSSVVEGLKKRPPTQHIAQLTPGNVGDALVHTINRDATERYTVLVKNGGIQVFDMTGAEKSVATPNGLGYLSTATPNTSIKATTIADYTFLTNTEINAAMAATVSDNNITSALVTVKQGQYGTKYKIKIDGDVVAEITTSNTAVADIQTEAIAIALQNDLGLAHRVHVTSANWDESTKRLSQTGAFTGYTWASGDIIQLNGGAHIAKGEYTITGKVSNDVITLHSSPSKLVVDALRGPYTKDLSNNDITSPDSIDFINLYDTQRIGSSLFITKRDGTKINCAVEDSFGNRAIAVATNVVQKITDLPLIGPDGFVTKVVGESSSNADDYYVKFTPLDSTQPLGAGNWVETVGPQVTTSFDQTTLPHVLVREANGTFTFKEASWSNRLVGDAVSNENPSFIGNPIQEIFLFENRLGFISKDNTILSEAGSFFNFWRTTVTSLLDSDPIDVAASGNPENGVSILKAAVPYNASLILFTDHGQFALHGADILTPKTVSIKQETAFNCDLTPRPIISGKNIFFTFTRGSFAGLREYFIDSISNTYDAADATGHVPRYIPGPIKKLAASTNEDIIVAISASDPTNLYVYKYYWNNNQKLQSSWSKWTFDGGTILNADFIDATLYLTIQRNDGVYFESLSIDPGALDTGVSYVTALDRRITNADCAVSYSAVTNLTTWTLPFSVSGSMQVVTRQTSPAAVLPPGTTLKLHSQSNTNVTVVGDYSTTPVWIGVQYSMIYQFSTPQLREQSPGGGTGVIGAGRIQIRNWSLLYDSSGYFRAEVTPLGRDTLVYPFTGRSIGAVSAPLDTPSLATGLFKFPIYSKHDRVIIKIINDSPFPSKLLSAEWEAMYVIRSTRF